ncbi:MAG TPA: hypothetical protein VMU83_01200 [Hanamia sp.]|nr:hypothetical protein [Hanamia sp.]
MKLQSNNLLENLTTNEIKFLTTEVKEIVCKSFLRERKRNFTAAELWDIQRRKKNLFTKKFAF